MFRRPSSRALARSLACLAALCGLFSAVARESAEEKPERGSIIEDRAARKLLQAGDTRLDVGEHEKALEIWESVIERYPRSPVRFDARLRLGDHLLDETREFDKARVHFEAAAAEANPDDEQRAYAILHAGRCFYESGGYGKSFAVMRGLIDAFPTSPHVNEAYHYLGLGHFKLGHYSRAIEALEKVGTAVSAEDSKTEKAEAGKRLHIRLDDPDFAILPEGGKIAATCVARSGDRETVSCDLIGRHPRTALGRIPTALGDPVPGNGILEIRGGDSVRVTYTDAHTADKGVDETRTREILVVGDAHARITDGSWERPLQAAVLGKALHLEVTDADGDTTAGADTLEATVEVLRRKTADEIDEALAAGVASGEITAEPESGDPRAQIDPLLTLRRVPVALRESERPGVFRAAVPLRSGSADGVVAAEPGQLVRLVYLDEVHRGERPELRVAEARVIEGNLGEMRVTRTDIPDEELRLKTRLRTASALTEVGNHYKEFGLVEKAGRKYTEALDVCEGVLDQSRAVGGQLLEDTYVQLWRIYFAMDRLELALGMSRRLLDEFPDSAFVDEAMLRQAHVERERGNHGRAIGLYSSVAGLPASPLRGEAQFFIGETYETMALESPGNDSERLFEQAFLAYRKVYEQFPDSGRVGDAVAKMAAFYYQKQDYARAVDVFENVLADYPDANFLDVILFNYGRCLYKLDRKAEARRRFERLIDDFPESEIAPEASKIAKALVAAGF